MKKLSELMVLDGRAALVTGGAGHIGLAIGEALIELGAQVAVVDLDADACEQRCAQLNAMRSSSAAPVVCDLRDEYSTRQAVTKTIELFGRLDILVHSAAWVGTTETGGWAVPFEQQSVSAWDAAMRVNLSSAFILIQAACAALAASGRGVVILIGSTYGIVGPDFRLYQGTKMAMPAGYAASKGGLIQLTRYMATLLAPDIRVNAISPGGVWRSQPEQFHDRYKARTPLGRMATEEDLKGAAAFLASDLSAYVTGHNLVVDGGWTAW